MLFAYRLIRIAVAAMALAAMTAPAGVTAVWAGSSSSAPDNAHPPGPLNREEIRKQREKEFLRQHSDASGKPRPDLWREGVEKQKQMQVAPYIGWHPPAKRSGSTDEK